MRRFASVSDAVRGNRIVRAPGGPQAGGLGRAASRLPRRLGGGRRRPRRRGAGRVADRRSDRGGLRRRHRDERDRDRPRRGGAHSYALRPPAPARDRFRRRLDARLPALHPGRAAGTRGADRRGRRARARTEGRHRLPPAHRLAGRRRRGGRGGRPHPRRADGGPRPARGRRRSRRDRAPAGARREGGETTSRWRSFSSRSRSASSPRSPGRCRQAA